MEAQEEAEEALEDVPQEVSLVEVDPQEDFPVEEDLAIAQDHTSQWDQDLDMGLDILEEQVAAVEVEF